MAGTIDIVPDIRHFLKAHNVFFLSFLSFQSMSLNVNSSTLINLFFHKLIWDVDLQPDKKERKKKEKKHYENILQLCSVLPWKDRMSLFLISVTRDFQINVFIFIVITNLHELSKYIDKFMHYHDVNWMIFCIFINTEISVLTFLPRSQYTKITYIPWLTVSPIIARYKSTVIASYFYKCSPTLVITAFLFSLLFFFFFFPPSCFFYFYLFIYSFNFVFFTVFINQQFFISGKWEWLKASRNGNLLAWSGKCSKNNIPTM